MRTESDLSYTNLDTIKEELAQMEEKIQAEEAQVNTKVVRNIAFNCREVRLYSGIKVFLNSGTIVSSL